MKSLMIALVGLVLAAGALQAADNYQEFTVAVTNGQTSYNTDDFVIAGLLDKVEVIKTGVSTCTVTLATFSGTTAVDTLATKQLTGAGTTVFRSRIVGTTTAGVTITSATNAVGNAGTVLAAPYERPYLGGFTKLRFVSDGDGGASTNLVRVFLLK